MAVERVLLMHGPVQSRGINAVVHQEFYIEQQRGDPYHLFPSQQNIISMAYVFRKLGFKIAYSGWEEDAEWLNANRDLFDYLVISNQHVLNTESTFFGQTIANNKEKLYYVAMKGLQLIRQHLGDDAIVFRTRADVTVHQGHAVLNLARIARHSNDILIEYMRVDNMYSSPDFMSMGEVAVLQEVYESLYRHSAAGTSYHVSSHVDHTFTYLSLKEEGRIGRIMTMSRELFESVVWRGQPRYFQHIDATYASTFSFDSELAINPALKVADLVARISPEVSGKEVRPPRSYGAPGA